jgi:hypothetical protein
MRRGDVLSVADVARGSRALSVDVRVKLRDSSTNASGCDPKASYRFSDPALLSVKTLDPCSFELTFDTPGTGIYHVDLRATDSGGPEIPVSVDQYGAKVDGQFTLIIDSCDQPENDVGDVDALLDSDDPICDVAVGRWDKDASDLPAKVLAGIEKSSTLAIDPIPVDSVDQSDWAGRGAITSSSDKSVDTGWVPTGTSEPPELQNAIVPASGDVSADALVQLVTIPPLPLSWNGWDYSGHNIGGAKIDPNDASKNIVISAHGYWYTPNGLVRVPKGDKVRTFVPMGTVMLGGLGLDIDTGHITGNDFKYEHVYTAGELMPNFTFVHLGSNEQGKHGINPTNPTTLANLIHSNQGTIDIAACAQLLIPTGATLAQALSKVPNQTAGYGGDTGYSRVTIDAEGDVISSPVSAKS